jgi:membrane protease YdiL (CAAX protease family)
MRLAVLLYGLFAALALGWGWYAGRPWVVLDPALASWPRTALGLGGGVGLGLAMVASSRLAAARFRWARDLLRWFASVLGPMPRGEVLALALLSSVGEEMLFRGAMQPSLGLWITSLVFALLHIPPRRKYWPWTLTAGVMGLCFGLLTLHSGSIAGAVVAHFIINYLNLLHVARAAAAARAAAGHKSDPPQNPE